MASDFYRVGIRQSISGFPTDRRAALTRENGLEPRKAFADKGEGCALSTTACLDVSINLTLAFAGLPHRTKTIGSGLAFTCRMISSVKVSQPRPLWERGSPARSVRIVFSIRTPCFAHGARQPLLGIGKPRSL